MRRLLALTIIIGLAAACGSATTSGVTTTEPSEAALTGVCGVSTPPRHVPRHVLWIWFENKPYGAVIGAPAAPFTTMLARRCAVALSYHAITHPSLPNYLAATSGTTHGVTDDAPPSAHPIRGASVFSQAGSWRAYQESMPGACLRVDASSYAVRHDPAVYYTQLRATCRSRVVALGTPTRGPLADALTRNTLPRFAFVTPNLCSDTHDCGVASGDAWLARWIRRITTSASYRAGGLVVMIVWDEDDRSAGNHVPLIVLAPGIRPATRIATPADHYTLLRTTEDLLGVAPIGAARSAVSLRPALGL
jgi:phosphatidylinositol-3-phosphatase